MHTLSKAPDLVAARYDAVVVGSGYGAGVAACRLARGGLGVAVLERGREWLTGEFPASLAGLASAFRVSGQRLRHGSRLALYDCRINDDIDVVVGCGLGGTSLVNACVCLKPDPRVLQDPVWPEAIRSDGLVDEGYARARQMLAPVPTPEDVHLHKLDALAASAELLATDLRRAPVHVNFRGGRNAANVVQPACTLCGDCCSGCNVGAKTTVQLSYIADAAQHGASIFTRCEVAAVGRNPDGQWTVHYHVVGPDGAQGPERTVTAGVVVLGAGTLGSSEILLRSRERGLALSDRLGHGFTGNGDSLAIAYNGEMTVNNVGLGHPPRAGVEPVGPAVAGLIDLRGQPDLADDVAIVEAALPSPSAGLLPAMLAAGNLPFGRDQDRGIADELGEFARAAGSVVGGIYTGALRNSQTLLGVGHDDAGGVMELVDGRLRVRWPDAGKQPIFARINRAFATAARANGASLVVNPMSLPGLGGKLTTVHPLGGCAVAEDRSRGVVDHKCRVFDGAPAAGAADVHDGLYVCDGSIMPRSLGVHPLFTITALAERAMMYLAADRNLEIDDVPITDRPPIVIAGAAPAPRRRGFFGWLAGLFSRGGTSTTGSGRS